MTWRQLVVGLVGWLVVVAVGSTLVWAVIARTGDQIVSSEPLVVATTSAAQPTGGHPATVSPRPSASTTPSATPTQTPSTQPPSAQTPSDQPPSAQPPSAQAPPSVSRTWQGDVGLLSARCRGGVISLVAAQPDAGFAVDVVDRGPARLEVTFNGREEASGKGSHVTANCVSGVPTFQVTPTGGEDGGDWLSTTADLCGWASRHPRGSLSGSAPCQRSRTFPEVAARTSPTTPIRKPSQG